MLYHLYFKKLTIALTTMLSTLAVVYGAADEGGKTKSLVFEEKFDVDLETLVHHRGWELPSGETKTTLQEDPERNESVLTIRQEKPTEEYVHIDVDANPDESYSLEYDMRTENVATDKWGGNHAAAEGGQWQVVSPAGKFKPGLAGNNAYLKMEWQGKQTKPGRSIFMDAQEDYFRNGTVRTLIQPRQHSGVSSGFAAGILLRQQTEDDQSAKKNYYVYLSGAGELRIARDAGGKWNARGSTLASTSVPMPARNDRSRPYLLEVEMQDDKITASVMTAEEYGSQSWNQVVQADAPFSSFDNKIASVSTRDDAYTSGAVGIAGYSSGGNKSIMYMDIQVIPSSSNRQTLNLLPLTQRGAVVGVQYLDGNGDKLGTTEWYGSVFGTKDWHTEQVKLPKSPKNTSAVKIFLGLEGKGKVSFDNLRLYVHQPELRAFTPTDGAEVDTRRPKFKWEGDFKKYRVEISPTRDFKEPMLVYAKEAGIRPLKSLTPGKEYFWRLLPWRSGRAGFLKSSPGPVMSFTVQEDASDWPPAVRSQAWQWAEGEKRPFTVVVSPNTTDFKVQAWVEEVKAELVKSDKNSVTFKPSQALEPGMHELKVKVTDKRTQQVVTEEDFVNNTKPGRRSRIGKGGIMHIDGEPFFPIGSYRDPSNEMLAFEGVMEADWNMIFSYYSAQSREKSQKFLDEAEKRGLKVMLRHPGGWGFNHEGYDKRRRWVAHFSQHPALAAWYLCDEPELYGYTQPGVKRMAKSVDLADPHTVTTMVSHYPKSFGRIGDIFMPMSYILGPFFGHSAEEPLDARAIGRMNKKKGQGITRIREVWGPPASEDRPIWAILQGFDPSHGDYKKHPERTREKFGPRSRPSSKEARCMAFAALSYDIQGILWWYHGKPDIRKAAPKAWEGIVRTSHELRSLEKFLVQPKTAEDKLSVPDPLMVWSRKTGNERILAIINPQVDPVSATVDISKFDVTEIRPRAPKGELGEARAVENGKLDLDFDSHEVKVFLCR